MLSEHPDHWKPGWVAGGGHPRPWVSEGLAQAPHPRTPGHPLMPSPAPPLTLRADPARSGHSRTSPVPRCCTPASPQRPHLPKRWRTRRPPPESLWEAEGGRAGSQRFSPSAPSFMGAGRWDPPGRWRPGRETERQRLCGATSHAELTVSAHQRRDMAPPARHCYVGFTHARHLSAPYPSGKYNCHPIFRDEPTRPRPRGSWLSGAGPASVL